MRAVSSRRLCVGRFVAQVVGREGAADVLCAEAAEEQVLHGVHGLSVLEAPGERGRQLRDLHLELAHLGCRRRPHVADCWRLGGWPGWWLCTPTWCVEWWCW